MAISLKYSQTDSYLNGQRHQSWNCRAAHSAEMAFNPTPLSVVMHAVIVSSGARSTTMLLLPPPRPRTLINAQLSSAFLGLAGTKSKSQSLPGDSRFMVGGIVLC